MSRKAFAFVLMVMIGLLSFGVAVAQDATQEPTPTNEIGLGDVVGNKIQYYGQQVTVEGTIEEVINVRSFILGDQAMLSEHRVLVINDSPQDFDIGVRKDQKVRVVGFLCPSFNEGGWAQLVGSNSVNGPSPTQQASANATQQAGESGNQTAGNTAGANGTAGNMAGCSANSTAGSMTSTNGASGNTTGSNSNGSSTGSTGNSTGDNSSGAGSNTTGSTDSSTALGASGGADQSNTNPSSLQNQNPGTPGASESSSAAATEGASGATAPDTSGAASNQQAAPTLMPAEQMTPGQAAAQQITNGNFDLSQMFIRPDLRDFTVLLLSELHITYIPS